MAHFAFWAIWATWINNQRRERGNKMIKKLSFLDSTVNCVDYQGYIHNVAEGGIINKINELVDAVNGLQKHEEQHLDLLTELNEMRLHQKKEPADPYAEQRKWIWHLCRFWFDDKKQADIGILGEIDEDGCYPYWNIDLGHHYKHCEPVKPDDDIIYKGSDNEL